MCVKSESMVKEYTIVRALVNASHAEQDIVCSVNGVVVRQD